MVKELPKNLKQLPLEEQEKLIVGYRHFLFELAARCTAELQKIRAILDGEKPKQDG
jgi:hypothetical protein